MKLACDADEQLVRRRREPLGQRRAGGRPWRRTPACSAPRNFGVASSPVRAFFTSPSSFTSTICSPLNSFLSSLSLRLFAQNLVVDPAEDGGPVVIVVLRPAVVRMVVAAGTLQPHAEEQPGRRLAAGERVAIGPIEIGRRIVVRAAAGGDQLADELVERLAGGDRVANPGVERIDALRIEHLLFVPQQVRPLQRPVLGELRPGQQTRRSAGPACRAKDRRRSAGPRRPSATGRSHRDTPGGRTSRRRPVGDGFIRSVRSLREDQLVDVVRRRRVAPDEVGPRRQERQRHRRPAGSDSARSPSFRPACSRGTRPS